MHERQRSLVNAGSVLPATCVGARVPARAQGQVHSVFARACNIELQGGELVTLLKRERDGAPHGICIAPGLADFSRWLRHGQHACIIDGALCLPAAGVTLRLSGAPIWRGAVAPVETPYSRATEDALQALRCTLEERSPEHGIARALSDSNAFATSALDRTFAARLRNVLPLLKSATEGRDSAAAGAAIARLIGLGPGLTPSGDDFLCGYLAALWSRAPFEQGVHGFLSALALALPPLFARTHAISRQLLRDAIDGAFARALAGVTMAIAGKGDVNEAAAHVLSSGHSSGADMLCGLLFGYAPALLMRSAQRGRAGTRLRAIASCAAAPA